VAGLRGQLVAERRRGDGDEGARPIGQAAPVQLGHAVLGDDGVHVRPGLRVRRVGDRRAWWL